MILGHLKLKQHSRMSGIAVLTLNLIQMNKQCSAISILLTRDDLMLHVLNVYWKNGNNGCTDVLDIFTDAIFYNIHVSFTFRELHTKAPAQILFNFCTALSLTLIVFIAAAEKSKTSSVASCRAAAIALHYFVLATFMWMAVEAYNMYLCFVKILPKAQSYFMTKCLIAGWGK